MIGHQKEFEADKAMDIQSVGDRIRRLRLASGIGQVELADRIGIASGTVSMIETGALPLPAVHVALLAHTLGVTESYLLRSRAEPVTTRPCCGPMPMHRRSWLIACLPTSLPQLKR